MKKQSQIDSLVDVTEAISQQIICIGNKHNNLVNAFNDLEKIVTERKSPVIERPLRVGATLKAFRPSAPRFLHFSVGIAVNVEHLDEVIALSGSRIRCEGVEEDITINRDDNDDSYYVGLSYNRMLRVISEDLFLTQECAKYIVRAITKLIETGEFENAPVDIGGMMIAYKFSGDHPDAALNMARSEYEALREREKRQEEKHAKEEKKERIEEEELLAQDAPYFSQDNQF